MPQLFVVPLESLGVLRIRGADARKFLQGQLSNDIERLEPHSSLLAGLHTPQGRTVAVLRVFALQTDDLLAVLPAPLLAGVLTRLSRFVLRAKVTLTDATVEWRCYGLYGPGSAAAARMRASTPLDADELRHLVVAPRHEPLPEGDRLDVQEWHALDIAAGLPQLLPATSELFVAQMLNLDALDGISFTKGCYTGQEVIARAHYRGKVKRRMQRFATESDASLAAGDSVRFNDGRSARIVAAVALPAGGQEFLAVTSFGALPDPDAEAASDIAMAGLEVEPLPLPYALPDLP